MRVAIALTDDHESGEDLLRPPWNESLQAADSGVRHRGLLRRILCNLPADGCGGTAGRWGA